MSDAGLEANPWVSHWNALSVALEALEQCSDARRSSEGQNDTLV
jgi:hypothetical protein